MAISLPIACILATLLTEGYARQCNTCFGLNPAMCIGSVQTCASSDDVCMATYTSEKVGPLEATTFIRMCGKASSCKQDQTLTTAGYAMRRSTTCCTSDNCTPPVPTLPPAPEAKENGVVCRACYANDASYCDTKTEMKCTGSENKCARYAITSTKDSKTVQSALRGCASHQFCEVGSSSSTAAGFTTKSDMACTDAGTRPEHGLLLPILAMLVLLKLFS
ncbi:hypothetical protein NDU88_011097 [Pleurodeles waltl]|uniref:UPAR/Ly6 domain-containing protein n=1 Tax=Pleurodeles waltl TaxID=8319 RepID=A0AAV7PXH8_PLEWA|nr:hypothetical protein NDU88_011097 [Pleurodeles waltl]